MDAAGPRGAAIPAGRILPAGTAAAAHRARAGRNLGLLVIDGYADLDPGGRPGLGTHAHAAFGIPVIDVAKTRFHAASHAGRLAGQQQGGYGS
ncbi:MAG TPA: hypothetical protein VK280_05720 [Streptosporangiaceae bacterium]|nr:hypothetical protein [Streptosporangiaceae bacterium]